LDLLRRTSGTIGGAAVSAAAAALLTPQMCRRLRVPSWLLWLTASIAAAITVNELVGKPIPFLRAAALVSDQNSAAAGALKHWLSRRATADPSRS